MITEYSNAMLLQITKFTVLKELSCINFQINPPQHIILRIHRGNVLEDVISEFLNPDILNKRVEMQAINAFGQVEMLWISEEYPEKLSQPIGVPSMKSARKGEIQKFPFYATIWMNQDGWR